MLENLLSVLFASLVISIVFYLPRRKQDMKMRSDKNVSHAIRSIFLLESLKVTNDDKSIDEVYEKISKYKGTFKIR